MILIDIRKSNKLKDSEYSAFIKFDYNSKIVDAIRELPSDIIILMKLNGKYQLIKLNT